jgi:hypothetical protein
MRIIVGRYLELAGFISVFTGAVFATHVLKIELPVVLGIVGIYFGRHLRN